jgi:uncharacterized Ntn-hydrolase superfamily protein
VPRRWFPHDVLDLRSRGVGGRNDVRRRRRDGRAGRGCAGALRQRRGVALLPDLAVGDALDGLLAQDDHAHRRQVHGLDARGNAYAFSGDGCDGWFGHQVHEGDGVTVAGNMLVGEATLDALVETYLDANGDVVERLIDALAAGKAAGGDERGHTSAAVKVKAPQTTAYHDLRVDANDEPIAELRAVYEEARAASEGFSEESKARIFD